MVDGRVHLTGVEGPDRGDHPQVFFWLIQRNRNGPTAEIVPGSDKRHEAAIDEEVLLWVGQGREFLCTEFRGETLCRFPGIEASRMEHRKEFVLLLNLLLRPDEQSHKHADGNDAHCLRRQLPVSLAQQSRSKGNDEESEIEPPVLAFPSLCKPRDLHREFQIDSQFRRDRAVGIVNPLDQGVSGFPVVEKDARAEQPCGLIGHFRHGKSPQPCSFKNS